MKSDPNDNVVMTYRRFLHEKATFPRDFNTGQQYTSTTYGPGQVTGTIYSSTEAAWLTEISYVTGYSETLALPVKGIDMFPGQGLVPEELTPRGEQVDPAWPSTVAKIKANVANVTDKIVIFQEGRGIPGVQASWKNFFDTEEAAIAACAIDPDGPYYRGENLYRKLLPTEAVLGAHITPVLELLPIEPYRTDPVVHASFTAAQRASAMEATRHPPSLLPGGIVLLKLRFGTAVPITHRVPFCLGVVPEDFILAAVPDAGLIKFKPYFSSSDIGGVWSNEIQGVILSAPLSSILASNLEFTQARKLKASSIKKNRSIVPHYDLGEEAPLVDVVESPAVVAPVLEP